jgi:hypothetical protein
VGTFGGEVDFGLTVARVVDEKKHQQRRKKYKRSF